MKNSVKIKIILLLSGVIISTCGAKSAKPVSNTNSNTGSGEILVYKNCEFHKNPAAIPKERSIRNFFVDDEGNVVMKNGKEPVIVGYSKIVCGDKEYQADNNGVFHFFDDENSKSSSKASLEIRNQNPTKGTSDSIIPDPTVYKDQNVNTGNGKKAKTSLQGVVKPEDAELIPPSESFNYAPQTKGTYVYSHKGIKTKAPPKGVVLPPGVEPEYVYEDNVSQEPQSIIPPSPNDKPKQPKSRGESEHQGKYKNLIVPEDDEYENEEDAVENDSENRRDLDGHGLGDVIEGADGQTNAHHEEEMGRINNFIEDLKEHVPKNNIPEMYRFTLDGVVYTVTKNGDEITVNPPLPEDLEEDLDDEDYDDGDDNDGMDQHQAYQPHQYLQQQYDMLNPNMRFGNLPGTPFSYNPMLMQQFQALPYGYLQSIPYGGPPLYAQPFIYAQPPFYPHIPFYGQPPQFPYYSHIQAINHPSVENHQKYVNPHDALLQTFGVNPHQKHQSSMQPLSHPVSQNRQPKVKREVIFIRKIHDADEDNEPM